MFHGHGAEISGTAFGFLTGLVPKLLGAVTIASVGESFVLGMAGATGGFIVTRLGKWAIETIKQNKKKHKNEKNQSN